MDVHARDHANQVASRLDQPLLGFSPGDHGSLAGYAKYRAATDAWGRSPLTQQTYFDPDTDPKAARALETCRHDGRKVRLVQGETATGRSWLDEHDVLGRSTGMMKMPLLIEAGADGGMAIMTSCLLRLIDWETGRDLYRHPAYLPSSLTIRRADGETDRPWHVLHDDTVMACFRDVGKAGAYLAFMCGETVEPRIFK